jgi:hypothetical protein
MRPSVLAGAIDCPPCSQTNPPHPAPRREERQFLADLKKAYLDSERQNRLRQAAERVKDVHERRSRRLALAEKTIETKLGQAERRQRAHILAIARKANGETSKVKEVSFITRMTTEALQHTLVRERLSVCVSVLCVCVCVCVCCCGVG